MPIRKTKKQKQAAAASDRKAAKGRKKKVQREESSFDYDSFGIPKLRQGEGAEILRFSREDITITLPLNEFFMMWELVEAKRAQHEKYADGPLAHVAKAYAHLVSEMRKSFYRSVYGHSLWSREVNYAKFRKQEAQEAEKKAKAGKTRPKAEKPAERSTEATPVKKKRCRECYDGDRTARCTGPEGHNGRHKDKRGRRWSSE